MTSLMILMKSRHIITFMSLEWINQIPIKTLEISNLFHGVLK